MPMTLTLIVSLRQHDSSAVNEYIYSTQSTATISPQALFEGKEVWREKEREALRLLTKPPKYFESEMENMQETCERKDENKLKGDKIA